MQRKILEERTNTRTRRYVHDECVNVMNNKTVLSAIDYLLIVTFAIPTPVALKSTAFYYAQTES